MVWEAKGERKEKEKEVATIIDARLAGIIMSASPGIQGIEVFGSVARDGKGRDLDLLILVDSISAGLWQRLVIMGMNNDVLSLREKPSLRREAAEQMLGEEFTSTIEELERTHPGVTFDLMLLPSDWRNQEYSEEESFMQRLKKEAVRIV